MSKLELVKSFQYTLRKRWQDLFKPNELYFIVVFNYRNNDIKCKRTWGWFYSFEEAERIVLNNETDLFEFYYNYALIEKVEQGIFGTTTSMQWYVANYNDGSLGECMFGNWPVIEKTDMPDWAAQTCNFSIG